MSKKLHNIIEIDNLKDMLKKSGEIYGEYPAYKFKTEEKGKFSIITHNEFRKQVDYLGTALINLGLRNKRIAVISENRYEWGLAYLAIACGTGVVVPLDKSLPPNEIESLIIRSGVEAIFYSKKYDEIMQDIKLRNTTDLRYYISMDLEARENSVLSQKELIKQGKEFVINGNRQFIDSTIDNEKMSFMLFTSGTTAMSKAVMLSHKNICANLMDIASVIEITENDTMLSFLPLHHTFECTVGFLYPLYKGTAVAYCDGIKHLAENIKEYEISAMISVPILYESMYKRLMKTIEKKGMKEKVEQGIKLSNILLKVGIDKRKKIFKEIHDNFGGKVRLFVSGAAALDPVVEKGFNDIGIKIVQGYGLTETSPVIAAGNDFYCKTGSVGKVLPSLKVKIVEKNDQGIGEIIVKGPSVMLGYYNNDEATKEVLKKDWFYTGDLGYIDKKGFLHISGRQKNVIVLKNGKNIFPEEIESVINRIEGVKESFIYGRPENEDEDDLKLCAKIVYDKEIFKNIYGTEGEEEILAKMWEKVKQVNKTMPPYKYIREIVVTDEELIKTTTQKVKRHEEMKKILGEMK